jgi:hypothetical protein
MFKRCTIVLSMFVLLFGFVPNAHATVVQPTTLAYLIDTQGSIQQGDKLFSDFTFVLESSDLSKTSPDDASGIAVSGITVNGNYGLFFSPAGCDNLIFAKEGAQLSMVIGYKVTVLDPDLAISDIHLAMGSVTLGNGSITVTESVYADEARTDPPLAQAQVTNPPEFFDADIVNLDSPVAMAYVTKEILIDGGGCDVTGSHYGSGDCGKIASIGFIKQLVSQGGRPPQEVPEPSTLLLLGSGLLGFLSRIRFRAHRPDRTPF